MTDNLKGSTVPSRPPRSTDPIVARIVSDSDDHLTMYTQESLLGNGSFKITDPAFKPLMSRIDVLGMNPNDIAFLGKYPEVFERNRNEISKFMAYRGFVLVTEVLIGEGDVGYLTVWRRG